MPAVLETHNCALISEVHPPSPDPLRCHLPLPLEGLYYPMGFPVRIWTDSPLVLQAVEEVWGLYTDRFAVAPLELRIGVTDTGPHLPPAAGPTARGHLITFLHSADNFLVADLDRGYAYGWLTQPVVSDAGYLRY